MTALDPRAPLVVDLHDLGRRAGSMREIRFAAPAPADLGNDVIGVPEGTDITGTLRAESVVEGVLVTGDLAVAVHGECVRCLDAIDTERQVRFQEMFLYPDQHPEDAEALRMQDDLIDLEPVLRDAIVLTLPLQPRCTEECPGLCPECGVRLADSPGHRHERTDPRWAALEGLLNDEEQ